jgi:hypothetical protein
VRKLRARLEVTSSNPAPAHAYISGEKIAWLVRASRGEATREAGGHEFESPHPRTRIFRVKKSRGL